MSVPPGLPAAPTADMDMPPMRYTADQHDALARDLNRDGLVVLRAHLDTALLATWRRAFEPLLAAHLQAERALPNRGAQRHYLSLPLRGTFASAAVLEDPDVLAIVERVVGVDPVLCQLATDTPLLGSDYQAWHTDTPPLFPEAGLHDTPSFQLALNFPLVDVTEQNGPLETTFGTHRMDKAQALEGVASGRIPVLRIQLAVGDLMIRDVRALHRGTPNTTSEPRPMVVVGYSRRWLHRPEVHIRVPQSTLAAMSARGRQLLRYNPVVPDDALLGGNESYRHFAY